MPHKACDYIISHAQVTNYANVVEFNDEDSCEELASNEIAIGTFPAPVCVATARTFLIPNNDTFADANPVARLAGNVARV